MAIYNFGKKIIDLFKHGSQIRHVYFKGIRVFTRRYHLNIFPTPDDATCTIGDHTNVGPTGANIWLGYEIDWSVEKENYGRVTGTWKATKDEDIYVTLSQVKAAFSLVMQTPSKSTVVWVTKQNGIPIDSQTYNNVTNFSRQFDISTGGSGTTFEYTISASGYVSQTGTWDPMTEGNKSLTINLAAQKFTVTINPTPSNATVVINGSARKTYQASYNETITWSVSATGYTAQTGSFVCTEAKTLNIALKATGGIRWAYTFVSGGETYYTYVYPNPVVGATVYGYSNGGSASLIQVCRVKPSSASQIAPIKYPVGNLPVYQVVSISGNNLVIRPQGFAAGSNADYTVTRNPQYDLYS